MPEIGEVSRVVSFLRKYIVGHTIHACKAYEDNNVFGKAGTSHTAVEKALSGKKVIGAKQQGKYFWLELDAPPQLLMHFSMAGWFHIKGVNTHYREAGVEGKEETDWPPKYVKFQLSMDDGTEAAFVDFRRFSRVKLVDCEPEEMRQTSPLKENGPDPVIDKDAVTETWLKELCAKKKAPIKAVLLDQANISGIGNWVSDEIFYDAKMHPEQLSNTLHEEQIAQLCKSIHYVCGLACETQADPSKFPDTWLFKYRWGKGKKDAVKKLPSGEKIEWLTVGGRTSAIIPSVQKKTGPVAADVEGTGKEDEKPESGTSGKRKRAAKAEDSEVDEQEEKPAPAKASRRKGKAQTDVNGDETTSSKKPKKPAGQSKQAVQNEFTGDVSGARRSKRISAAG